MDQTQIYSYLKNLLPGDIPFLNESDDPPESGTYARMCVETVFPVGCCQQRQHTLDETHQTVCAAYDLERLYSVRLVFCGDEALHYALLYQQLLEISLTEADKPPFCLKTSGEIKNESSLSDASLLKTYTFVIGLGITDTVLKEHPYLTRASWTIRRFGNY